MLAVLGVPQMLSGYFDIRERRRERAEQDASAERRHQEMMTMIANLRAEIAELRQERSNGASGG